MPEPFLSGGVLRYDRNILQGERARLPRRPVAPWCPQSSDLSAAASPSRLAVYLRCAQQFLALVDGGCGIRSVGVGSN